MSVKIDDGGPAFPLVEPATECNVSVGMSLRDYFAAKAMVVGLAETNEYLDEHWRMGVALDAYAMADAMLAARDKR